MQSSADEAHIDLTSKLESSRCSRFGSEPIVSILQEVQQPVTFRTANSAIHRANTVLLGMRYIIFITGKLGVDGKYLEIEIKISQNEQQKQQPSKTCEDTTHHHIGTVGPTYLL
jgi:hypothetical protein